MKPPKRPFAATTANTFGPKSLLTIRESLIAEGVTRNPGDRPLIERRSRKTVDGHMQTIERIFKWARA